MKNLRLTITAIGILTMLSTNLAQAAFLNLGTLDVKPLGSESSNGEWLVEYVEPGNSIVRHVQVANFSPEKKDLELYATDASKKLSELFTVKTKEEGSEKMAPWMSMPATSLTLNPGETKIVPVKINIPQNAGVGLHKGAVIVREKNRADGTEFFVEKGVRLYLNVKGAAIDKTSLTAGQTRNNGNHIGYAMIFENTGTVDYDSDLSLELSNFGGETVSQNSVDTFLRPGEKKNVAIETEKPAFGIFQATLKSEQPLNGQTQLNAGTIIVLPFWALVAIAALAMLPAFFTSPVRATKRQKRFSFNLGNLDLQKSFSFLGVLLMSGMMSLPLLNSNSSNLFADILESGNPQNYEVTVKWGNIRKLVLNKKTNVDWHGQLKFTDATVAIKTPLNLENGDAINLVDSNTVNFNLTTNTNNDGVVLEVTPTSDAAPKMSFENFPTSTKQSINLRKSFNGKIVIPNGNSASSIEIKGGSTTSFHGAALTSELPATPEAAATPEININIPELKSIFADIPATPEVLSEFILTSDYVKRITTENALTKIETDSTLIRALESTPEIIEEIAATPNLNFTFIPSETITFPAQQFSFNQDKTTTQDLGTIIFVQNKQMPWNTYIGTTNFVSLSGRGIIPAGNLKVIPGEAKILKQEDGAQVNEGIEKNIEGTFDKSILVNVEPGSPNTESKTIFTMNPKLQIKIPHGTPPGKYRGMLTLTSL